MKDVCKGLETSKIWMIKVAGFKISNSDSEGVKDKKHEFLDTDLVSKCFVSSDNKGPISVPFLF